MRIGARYEVIRDVLKRFWNVELPDDPGREVLPFGNLKQLPPSKSLVKLMGGLEILDRECDMYDMSLESVMTTFSRTDGDSA